jgi:tetratricopeptide (TPR) repeat protein
MMSFNSKFLFRSFGKVVTLLFPLCVASLAGCTTASTQDLQSPSEDHCKFARAYLERGQFQDAIVECNEAIQQNANNDEAYQIRGVANGQLGKNDLALSDYTQAIQINPLNEKAYGSRAARLGALGRDEEALKDFNFAMKLGPCDANLLIGRASTLETLGRYEPALEDCNKAIELDKSFADAYRIRALAHARLNNLPEAIRDFDEVLRLTPEASHIKSARDTLKRALEEHHPLSFK